MEMTSFQFMEDKRVYFFFILRFEMSLSEWQAALPYLGSRNSGGGEGSSSCASRRQEGGTRRKRQKRKHTISTCLLFTITTHMVISGWNGLGNVVALLLWKKKIKKNYWALEMCQTGRRISDCRRMGCPLFWRSGQDAIKIWGCGRVGGAVITGDEKSVSLLFIIVILSGKRLLDLSCHSISNIISYFGWTFCPILC